MFSKDLLCCGAFGGSESEISFLGVQLLRSAIPDLGQIRCFVSMYEEMLLCLLPA